jgi:hypothetical protein
VERSRLCGVQRQACWWCCLGSKRLVHVYISISIHMPSVLLYTALNAHTFMFKVHLYEPDRAYASE